MDYTVVLQCDKRSGVLIRVTAVLRQHGLQVESQHAATDRRHTCWSISASGSAVAMPEVTQALEHTAGVERVVSFVNGHGGHVEDDSIPVVDELVEPEQELLPTPEQELLPTDEGTFDLPDLDTATDDVVEPQVPVDEFIPDLDIINDIVERFPNIQLAVDKLKARAGPEEAESRLIAVG
ncbi:MAG: hypothetical protein ACR2RB_00155, partial [Gammaproteobacteria bacterium]